MQIFNSIRGIHVNDLSCRHTLYPTLEDHDLVKQYPHVRGFAKDVFFFSHSHRENGGAEESAGSKYNTFEVSNSTHFLT